MIVSLAMEKLMLTLWADNCEFATNMLRKCTGSCQHVFMCAFAPGQALKNLSY